MSIENKLDLKTAISGSFKFKPEIDRAIEEFQDYGVMVLAPEKGWLYIPYQAQQRLQDKMGWIGFRPLPSEKNMSLRQIEDSFLRCVSKSDFLYIMCPEGYIGNSVGLEMGAALALGIPIYSSHHIPAIDPEEGPHWERIIKQIKVMSVEDTVKDITFLKGLSFEQALLHRQSVATLRLLLQTRSPQLHVDIPVDNKTDLPESH